MTKPKAVKGKEVTDKKRIFKNFEKSYELLKKLVQWVTSHGKSADLCMIEVQLEQLESHYHRCFEYDELFAEQSDDDDVSPSCPNDYEDLFVTSKARLLQLIKGKTPEPKHSLVGDANQSIIMAPKTVQLPKLQPPRFSGNYGDWLDFKNEFSSMIIENSELSDVERFRFLKSCLVDGAKRTISQMEASTENFKSAWNALVERYENKALMFQTHINDIIMMAGVHKESSNGIREMLDSVTAHYRALSSLGSKDELAENLLICLMLSKLDTTTAIKWEESTNKNIPTWDGFCAFLEKRASTLEKIDYNKLQLIKLSASSAPRSSTSSASRPSHINQRRNNVFVSSSAPPHCVKCSSKEHSLSRCPRFIELSPNERYRVASKNRICVLCLGERHGVKICKAKFCERCHKRHHTLLHFETGNLADNTSKISLDHLSSEPHPPQSALVVSNAHDEPSILATAIINILDNKGSPIPCRTLLDSCASTNFVSERFVKILGMDRQKTFNHIGGIGASKTTSKGSCQLTIMPCFGVAEHFQINATILSKITDAQPPSPIPLKSLSIPFDIQLADPKFFQPQNVDFLIGAGLFWHILLPKRVILGVGLPVLQDTKFGWIVGGPFHSEFQSKPSALLGVQETERMNDLEELVKRFWEMDSLSSRELQMSPKNQECEDHFALHTQRQTNGSYVVRLPFLKDPSVLGQSREVALRRFLNLERRLNKQPAVKEMYSAFINEYRALNHLEVVNHVDTSTPHFYLPHHCVMKMGSSTTKLRVVFDGSCKTSSGVSLNDILHTGPKLQEDLFITLLKFRLFRYVLTGDIQKMYRQVRLHDTDQNFQLILWRFDQKEPIQTLRLSTVTYGTACGSYLAIKALHRISYDEEKNFPLGARAVRRNFYVDDMMVGANTIEELMEIHDQTVQLLKKGGFSLSKFCSNNEQVISSIDPQLQEKFLRIDDHDVIKALGLIWEPKTDAFRYAYTTSANSERVTKRIVLSEMASLFDPLGLLCPIITLAKIFYQELWKLKLDWDTEMSPELSAGWNKFRLQLGSLSCMSIPRLVLDVQNSYTVELHGFSDASEKAYGACIYLRSICNDQPPLVQLLCAKSKVSPTKTVTIARLELMAAKMLADLVSRLKKEVLCDVEIAAEYFWTDSLICLCWLNQEPHHWNIFVAHRVAKIQQLSKIKQWRHIPGEKNPADIVSRGKMPSELANSTLWFSGPEFLRQSEEHWPSQNISTEDTSERRQIKTAFVSITSSDITEKMHFSTSFRGVRRCFAYVFRFFKNCKHPSRSKEARKNMIKYQDLVQIYPLIVTPTIMEEEEAEKQFLCNIQKAAFPEEYQSLASNHSVANNSRLKCLAPFIDDDNLIRVGGRIKKADVPFDSKHQILLPQKHPFSASLILYFHYFRTFHAGARTVLTATRFRYWVINGSVECRCIIRRCVWCFRMRPKFLMQIMGNLPKERLDYKNLRPFGVTGVDFAGPLSVRHHMRCKVGKKVYVALFICMATKAVHLELVIDLSTEAFIRALKRFVSDRGMVRHMFSDNATNFKGTANQLKEIQQMLKDGAKDIHQACNQQFVQWSFIPPRAPNFGGLWEASIKITKRLIRNVVGLNETTVDELHTIIRQVAAIVNSRPITPISSDPNDLQPLTPGHFLYGGPASALPALPIDVTINQIKLYQHVNWVSQQFWKRFQKEYLSTLQPRTKWTKQNQNLVEGDMVLVRDDLAPPLMWSIGRIIHTTPDDSGVVRIVRVRTSTGEFDRAISGVAVLPIKK